MEIRVTVPSEAPLRAVDQALVMRPAGQRAGRNDINAASVKRLLNEDGSFCVASLGAAGVNTPAEASQLAGWQRSWLQACSWYRARIGITATKAGSDVFAFAIAASRCARAYAIRHGHLHSLWSPEVDGSCQKYADLATRGLSVHRGCKVRFFHPTSVERSVPWDARARSVPALECWCRV